MSSALTKTLYIYENNASVRELEIEPGRHYLGIDEREQLKLAAAPEDLHQALVRLELLKDGSAAVRSRRADLELIVNDRRVREIPLSTGDEILLLDFVMTWEERKELKGYVFANQQYTPFLVVEDGSARDTRVAAVIPEREFATLEPLASGGDSDAGFNFDRFTRQMSSLLIVTREINGISDPEEILDRMIDYLFSVLMIDRAAILLSVSGQPDLDIRRVAYRRQAPPDSIRLPSSITSQAIERRSALLVTNASEDPRYKSKPSVIQGAICSAMALPLIFQDELLGLLYIDTSNPAVTFSVDDLKFMAVFANLTTVAMRNARRLTYLERKTTALQDAQIQSNDPFIVGSSDASQKAYKLLQRVAKSKVSVLLTGESGSGKEVAARRLHAMSPRANEAFIAINCAAVPETLIEAEIFGHEKGAFTGAESTKPGKFELADGGTLLLDEIGEIPAAFQAKLLRVLEGHGFERVGGTRPIKVDVRLIAATNRDLRVAVKKGEFREDLFYRLSVFPVHLKPLRERSDDILDLAHYFIGKFAEDMNVPPIGFTDAAEKLLCSYRWPGNVRELRNLIERLIILSDSGVVEEETLRESLYLGQGLGNLGDPDDAGDAEDEDPFDADSSSNDVSSGGLTLWEQEAAAIKQALHDSGGNKSQAARALGISRHHLVYRMKKYKIEV